MYRLIFAVTAALALGWMGMWVQSSIAMKRGIAQWAEDRRAEGWTVDYSTLRVRGFPSRLDATLRDLDIKDPARGLGWQAPEFKILGLTYRPGHQILIFPTEQVITWPGGTAMVSASGMRASLVHDADTRILRSNVEADETRITLAAQTITLTNLRIGAQEIAGLPARYRLGIGAETPGSTRSTEALQIQAEIGFAKPWQLETLAQEFPALLALSLRRGEIALTEPGFGLTGQLDFTTSGRATGALNLRTQDVATLGDNPLLPKSWIPAPADDGALGPRELVLHFHQGQVTPKPTP